MMKVRYERLKWNPDLKIDVIDSNKFFDLSVFNSLNVNCFEIENKFKFKHANVAIGIPLGYYNYNILREGSAGYFIVDPRVYLTLFSSTNIFELSFIPKVHIIIFDDLNFYPAPAFSIGLGLSSNLKKWVLRPEFGFDGIFSYGVGLNINLNNVINLKND